MAVGYTRQEAANIATSNVIQASHFNNEFNAIVNAFSASTGHNHDGTTGGGAQISLTSAVTGVLPLANGGTGGTDAASVRTSLDLVVGTDIQAYSAALESITGLTTAADKMIYTTASNTYAVTDLSSFARGILDDANAAAVRTTIGLGSIATQEASGVTITGGTVTGITDITIADGGTGASDAPTARTNLGLGDSSTEDVVPVSKGGTGLTNVAAYTVVCGGTTSTGDLQSVSGLGDSGQILTSNGLTSLPSWQTLQQPTFSPGHVSGTYFGPTNFSRDAETNLTVTSNRLYALPIFVPQDSTYTGIGISVTTIGGSSARLGIYENLGGVPGDLLLDAGTVPTTTTGAKEISISEDLTSGWYWLTMVFNGAATISATDTNINVLPILGGANGGGSITAHYYTAHTFGALPAAFGVVTAETSSSVNCPWIGIKV